MSSLSCLSSSDGTSSKRKQPGDPQAPPPSDPRPPSPPGPPPSAPPASETQPNQDISPAVAAALLQLISQQDPEAPQRNEDPSPAVDAPAQPPPPWAADSPPKSSAEAPAGLGTSAPAQFPKDQDLRFSHGAARWDWASPPTCELAYRGIGSSSQTRNLDGITPILWLTGPWSGSWSWITQSWMSLRMRLRSFWVVKAPLPSEKLVFEGAFGVVAQLGL